MTSKKSKAYLLFKSLGYKYERDKENDQYVYYKDLKNYSYIFINFDNKTKTVSKYKDYFAEGFTVDELKAVKVQIEELGWKG